MDKDFVSWHKKKSVLHYDKIRPFFSEREIWFCTLGNNIGYEQDGRGEQFLRPIIVIKKFNNEIFWGVPLTKTEKTNKYYFKFSLDDNFSHAILSQIRLIDAKRLNYKIGDMSETDFAEIKKRLRQFLA